MKLELGSILKKEMESIHSEISNYDTKKPHPAQLLLALVREQYLQAKPPQQIEELKDLFQKNVHGGITKGASVTSSEDQPDSSIREKTFVAGLGLTPSPHADDDDMRRDEGLDGVGSKTKESEGNSSSIKDCGNESDTKPNTMLSDEEVLTVIGNVYDSTIGYRKHPLSKTEDNSESGSFLHPPIQYRIAFAKHIIKQLESGNWSTPQGSHEKDKADPVEQETLLERWYEGLELLSQTGQALSEPFYRLYEIKMVHHYNKEGATQEMVKIFENETSFVADGTTGLVTWKASTHFLKWLSAQGVREENGTLFASLDGREPTRWIVELGCGCGLVAIAVTKFMPPTLEQYIATDGSLAALEKAKLNVDANFNAGNEDKLFKSKIRFERVESQNEATSESFSQLVDGMTTIYGSEKGVLLGADIIFDPELIPDLVRLMQQFLETRAGRIILSSTIRNASTMRVFKTEIDLKGLAAKQCGSWEDGEILEIYYKNST